MTRSRPSSSGAVKQGQLTLREPDGQERYFHRLPIQSPRWGADSGGTPVTGARAPGERHRGPPQARFSGAIVRRSFLRPTEVKITTASASSPEPEVSTRSEER